MKNKKQFLLIVLILLTTLILLFIFKKMDNKKNIKGEEMSSVTISETITPEELSQGWYWGETKRSGTPADWTLENAGTRGARWVSPLNVE